MNGNQPQVSNEYLYEYFHEGADRLIISSADCRNYKVKEYIFREGEKPKGLYTIESGQVKIFKLSPSGSSHIIRFANAGDVVGYDSLLSTDSYEVSALAVVKAEVCLISKSIIRKAFKTDQGFSEELIKFLSERLKQAYERMTSLASKSLKERLAESLLIMGRFAGNESTFLSIDIDRQDLADVVGAAKESTIRLLMDIKNEGLIKIEKGKIYIEDPRGLSNLAQLAD